MFFQEIGSSGWYVGFILWTIILCLLVRFIGVYIFTFLANKWDDDVSFPAFKSFQVPSEADQPAGAVHHGLRGAARRRRIFPRQDGQHVRMGLQ